MDGIDVLRTYFKSLGGYFPFLIEFPLFMGAYNRYLGFPDDVTRGL